MSEWLSQEEVSRRLPWDGCVLAAEDQPVVVPDSPTEIFRNGGEPCIRSENSGNFSGLRWPAYGGRCRAEDLERWLAWKAAKLLEGRR